MTTSSVSIHYHYLELAQKLEKDDELHLLPSFIAIIYIKKRMTTSSMVACHRFFIVGKELE
jgi:hypothetical protein